MSFPAELPPVIVGEQFSNLDTTTLSSIVPQTLTVFTPTIVATAFVPQDAGRASATASAAPQNTSAIGNFNSNSNSKSNENGISSDSSQSSDGNRTTVILATVMSVVGCLVLGGTVWLIMRRRRRRSSLFTRGITPIGDDEIETWKGQRTEKGHDMFAGSPPTPPPHSSQQQQSRVEDKGHHKSESATSIKKPPSVIVYARKSEELSPRSPTMHDYPFSKMSLDGGKRSLDKELPFTPIQARAPNAREGLTDEAIPGDEPFVGSPKRRGSRLSKVPRYPHHTHLRTKSSRSSSSLQRLGDRAFGYESDDYRPSYEFHPGHTRVSSHEPPRLSLSDDWPSGSGSLSPRTLIIRAEDIGRAIG